MGLEFRNIVSLSLIYGFFATVAIIIIADIFIFGTNPAESQIVNILIGAMIGYVGAMITALYKAKSGNGND